MARSHHRKKHKEQVRQFKHKSDTSITGSKSKSAGLLSVVAGVVGAALGYIVSNGSMIWTLLVLVAGAAMGYLIGRKIDASR